MKLREQSRFGRTVILAVLTVLLIPALFNLFSLPQALTIEGTYIRDGHRAFPRFLEAIKANHGVLVLGTSETAAHLSGENYWMMLNRDRDVKANFSVLAGAGRVSYVWFPPILANQKAFRGLRVLYYLNPTYWRYDLNYFAMRYYKRYNGDRLVREVLPAAKRYQLNPFIDPYLARTRPERDNWADIAGRGFESYKSYFSHDLARLFQGGMVQKNRYYNQPSPEELAMWQDGLDLNRNASRDYLEANPYSGIPTVCPSDFQYRSLQAFVRLAKRVGIDLVVFIGPYNGIMAQRNSPDVIPGYQDVLRNVKRILNDSRTPYIDGSDLSYTKGVFADAQHHSTYGAWKIEQRMAEFYGR